MSMIDTQRSIVATSCFSTKRIAETITYEGKEISALVEIGASFARTDWNDAATTTEEARLADAATISVLDTDVPSPQEGDVIVYKSETYFVSRVINHDEAGGNFVLDAMKNGKAYGR